MSTYVAIQMLILHAVEVKYIQLDQPLYTCTWFLLTIIYI